jgi:virulence-associated protein VagC
MPVEEKSKRVVRPKPGSWDWLDAIAGTFDEDFLQGVLESSQEAHTDASDQATTDEMFS